MILLPQRFGVGFDLVGERPGVVGAQVDDHRAKLMAVPGDYLAVVMAYNVAGLPWRGPAIAVSGRHRVAVAGHHATPPNGSKAASTSARRSRITRLPRRYAFNRPSAII